MSSARVDRSGLLDLLERAPGDGDRAAIVDAESRIHDAMAALSGIAASGINAAVLTKARFESSNTLRPNALRPSPEILAVRSAWSEANELVVAWVSAEQPMNLEGVRHLNAKLRGQAGLAPYRDDRPYLDQQLCPPAKDVDPLLAPMLGGVQQRLTEDGVLFGAGALYRWLVSVHPFADANGRTSRLVTDWFLGLHGYVPISFADPFDSFVAVSAADAQPRTLRQAAEVIATGVLHTLAILSGTFTPGRV